MGRNGRERSEDGADDHISERASKVFEVLEGGAAERKPGRRKLNVFARWAISTAAIFSNTVGMSSHRILGKAA
jgi:hypothetical protein